MFYRLRTNYLNFKNILLGTLFWEHFPRTEFLGKNNLWNEFSTKNEGLGNISWGNIIIRRA